jgi:hypothetical protein
VTNADRGAFGTDGFGGMYKIFLMEFSMPVDKRSVFNVDIRAIVCFLFLSLSSEVGFYDVFMDGRLNGFSSPHFLAT